MEFLIPFACFLLGIIFACVSIWMIFPYYMAKLWDKTKNILKGE